MRVGVLVATRVGVLVAAFGWLATALVLVWPAVTVLTVWLILRLRALEEREASE